MLWNNWYNTGYQTFFNLQIFVQVKFTLKILWTLELADFTIYKHFTISPNTFVFHELMYWHCMNILLNQPQTLKSSLLNVTMVSVLKKLTNGCNKIIIINNGCVWDKISQCVNNIHVSFIVTIRHKNNQLINKQQKIFAA